MFQFKQPESSRGVRHMHKCCLHTHASLDTWRIHVLDMQLSRVIAEFAIHLPSSNGKRTFGQNQ